MTLQEKLIQTIRTVENFPKPGISFKDITPILLNPSLLVEISETLAQPFKEAGITKVIGIESRGFFFGLPLAIQLKAGFVPVRKPGKLPAETLRQSYDLEYGTDILEVHQDAIQAGDKVLIHDDVLATGGTAEAVMKMTQALGGEVMGFSFLIELGFLAGAERIAPHPIEALLRY